MKSKLFFLLGIGCLIIFVSLLWKRQAPIAAPTAIQPSISIPSIQVNLPILSAHKNGSTWETTDKGVSYLVGSAIPGEKGNSIFYGHNWPNILGRLTNVKTGQLIEVKTASGKVVRYKVEYTAIVSDTQDEVLQPTKDYRLTIYTCTGLWDEKRFVAVAFVTT